MAEAPPQSPRRSESALDATASAADRVLEARLRRLEDYLGFQPLAPGEVEGLLNREPGPMVESPKAKPAQLVDEEFEGEIGEYWLARIGVVALIIGLGFLVAYPFAALPAAVPSIIGFVAGGLCLVVSRRWTKALPEMSRLLFLGTLFLSYFATLRLHFFSASPVVGSRGLVLVLLVAVNAVQYLVAYRRQSEFTAVVVTVLAMVTAFTSDSIPVALALQVAVAGVAVAFSHLRGWHSHYGFALLGSFFVHLLMLVGNPLAGHAIKAVASPMFNLPLLMAYAAIYALAGFLPGLKDQHPWLRALRPIVVGGGVLLLSFFNVWLFYRSQAPWVEFTASAFLLVLAVIGWVHHQSRLATSFYSCAAYFSLTVFLIRFFPVPDCYGWLAWQSLLVAATAVWFRSKIIVVSNLLIFGGIYVVYLLTATASGPVNLSFAIVALITARILNWQKERLDLQTELMRNLYLGAATIAIPYGLYHTVAAAWVSTAWLATAAAFFGISVYLRNRKYRWMAIATVFATIAYVFLIDLGRLAPAYRIVSFLVLGLFLLVISVFYTRSRQKREERGGGSEPGT